MRQAGLKKRIRTFKETGYFRCIYQNKLDKSCFQHNNTYEDYEDLPRRAADKVLYDKASNLLNI